MRDFPIFTTEFGVSSLILKEIPYRNEAYIHIRDVQPGHLHSHLLECVSFCRMAGAERIFACGYEGLRIFPCYTAVYEMKGHVKTDPDMIVNLFPVTDNTVGQWRLYHNQAMRSVDNAGTLETKDEKCVLSGAGAYFIHDKGELLGIGWLEGDKLLSIASVKPGAGKRVLHTLLSLKEGDMVRLEVASTNLRALRLYEGMGFIKTREVNCWYDVSNVRSEDNGLA